MDLTSRGSEPTQGYTPTQGYKPTTSCEPTPGLGPTRLTETDIMDEIYKIGLGKLPDRDWQPLIKFRMFLPEKIAVRLLDCLFHVCNGRVKSSTQNYGTIAGLDPKRYPWSKVFLIMEAYCGYILVADATAKAKAKSQPAPNANSQPGTQDRVIPAKEIDINAIAELAKEHTLLDDVSTFFSSTVKHLSLIHI